MRGLVLWCGIILGGATGNGLIVVTTDASNVAVRGSVIG